MNQQFALIYDAALLISFAVGTVDLLSLHVCFDLALWRN